jgi:hypothetical protein
MCVCVVRSAQRPEEGADPQEVLFLHYAALGRTPDSGTVPDTQDARGGYLLGHTNSDRELPARPVEALPPGQRRALRPHPDLRTP